MVAKSAEKYDPQTCATFLLKMVPDQIPNFFSKDMIYFLPTS